MSIGAGTVGGYDCAMTFIGENGYMRIERPNRIVLHTKSHQVIDVKPITDAQAFERQANAFVDSIINKTPFAASVESGVSKTVFVEAAHRSAKEEKKVYLPQLLMSAEAAKSAFEVIKQHLLNNEDIAEELKAESEKLNRVEVKSPGAYTKEEIDAMDDEEMKQNCRTARIEANKKYVRRDDVQMTDERKMEMMLRIAELVAWGETPSTKAEEVCAKYNIVVPGFNDTPAPSLFDTVEETPKEETVTGQEPATEPAASEEEPATESEEKEQEEPTPASNDAASAEKPSKKKKSSDPYDL